MRRSCLGLDFQSVVSELTAWFTLDHFHFKNKLFTNMCFQKCSSFTVHSHQAMVQIQFLMQCLTPKNRLFLGVLNYSGKERYTVTLVLTSNESPLMTSAQSCFLRNVFSSRWASVRVTTDLNTWRLWVLDTKRELLAMQVAVSSLSPVNIQICNIWTNLWYKYFKYLWSYRMLNATMWQHVNYATTLFCF
jgi:hypothetical protein